MGTPMLIAPSRPMYPFTSPAVRWSGSRDGKQLPWLVNPLQGMGSSVLYRDVSAGNQVPDRSRDEDLAGPGRGHHSGGKVHRDPADVVVALLDLAGMQPGPDLEADAAQLVPERGCTADPPAGAVEGGQDPVAGRLDQLAAELLDQPPSQVIVDVQQLTPTAIPKPAGLLGRRNDVGEQHRR